MSTEIDSIQQLARAVAPEDIRPGDYIFPLHAVQETSDCPFESPGLGGPKFVLRLPYRTTPVRVLGVCLPLLLAQDAQGRARTIDVRRWRLATLPEAFGRQVFEQLAPKTAGAAGADPESCSPETA